MNNLLAKTLLDQDILSGLDGVVRALSNDVLSNKPNLYFLSVLEGGYKKMVGNGGKGILPITYKFEHDLTITAERDGCVLAFVTGDIIKQVPEETRELVSGILLHFYDLLFFKNYYKQIKKPIDFTKTSTYYCETAELLSAALGMPMVAIRRLNTKDYLENLCFYDWSQLGSDGRIFFSDDIPPPFKSVLVDTERLILEDRLGEIRPSFHSDVDVDNPRYKFLKQDSVLHTVKTFVIFPIVYGHELFGIMSCATRCRYVFSDIQKQAVGGLMQIIGVAISNFLRYHEAQELHQFRTEQIVDTTAVEVAKSTKHELSNAQAEASTMLVSLKRAIDGKQVNKIKPAIHNLEVSIDNLLPSIQKLSFGNTADKEPDETSIKEIWDRVVTLFSERLKLRDIATQYQGPTCEGLYRTEMLQNAFLNLILNSIDAFKTRNKRGRKITIVARIVSGGERCQIDYSDNAGGLNLVESSYKIPDHISKMHPDLPLTELIFLPKVSSKGGLGSGWGLYLVRRAINTHKGSISLVDYKNGCTFRIELPRFPNN